MKINSISTNFNIFKLNNQSQQYKITAPLKTDTFSKANEVSFTGLSDSDKKKVSSFSKDLYRIFYIDKNFDLEKIQKIARKYDKGLSVKSMQEAPNEYGYDALYAHKTQIDADSFDINIADRTLYLDETRVSDADEINEFYVAAIHEFTHAIQEQSKEMSCPNIVKSYLARNKNSANRDDVLKNAVMSNRVAHGIEDIIATPIAACLNTPVIVSQMVKGKHSPNVGMELAHKMYGINDYNAYVRQSVNQLFNSLDEGKAGADRKHLLTYTAKHLECEAEAYNTESGAYAKVMDKNVASHFAYLISVKSKVFSEASRILMKMAREC